MGNNSAGIGGSISESSISSSTTDITVNGATIGKGAYDGGYNTVLGEDSLGLNESGVCNTAIGYQSMDGLTSGKYNTALGCRALDSITTGDYNIAIGYNALKSLTKAEENTAIGYMAMMYGASAEYSVAVGSKALYSVTTGKYNTGCGAGALYNSNGSYNVSMGISSGFQSTGSYNTYLGGRAGMAECSGDYNICIGYESAPSSTTVEGEITLGDTNITDLRCNDTSISSLSDIRDKTDIKDSPFGLEFLNELRVIDYLWDTREGNAKDGTREVGYSAQDLISLMDKYDNGRDLKLANDTNLNRIEADYNKVGVISVKAIQELSKKHDSLEDIVKMQAKMIEEQGELIKDLTTRLELVLPKAKSDKKLDKIAKKEAKKINNGDVVTTTI